MPKSGSALSARDTDLLKYAAEGLSAQEMAKRTGLPAAQCLVQVKKILADRNPWTVAEERQLLLVDMKRLKTTLMSYVDDGVDDKIANAITKNVIAINDLLTKQGAISEKELEVVTRAQAFTLMKLIQAGFDHAKKLLAEQYPDYPLAAIEPAFNDGLRIAAAEYDE